MQLPVPVVPIEKAKKSRGTLVTEKEIADFKKDMQFINEKWDKTFTFIYGYSKCGATITNQALWLRTFFEDGTFKDWFAGWSPYDQEHTMAESD